MKPITHGPDMLARTPDPSLAADACRAFLRAYLFNEGEHVEWDDLDQVLTLTLRAFGIDVSDVHNSISLEQSQSVQAVRGGAHDPD